MHLDIHHINYLLLRYQIMRKLIPLKFVSQILLVIMLVVAVNGVHESAHAMQDHVKVSSDQASLSQISAPHQCPCAPPAEHKDYDGCDTCINCACHAPLPVQVFKLSRNSIILNLITSEPFTYLPEVYLSKFIPPQIHAYPPVTGVVCPDSKGQRIRVVPCGTSAPIINRCNKTEYGGYFIGNNSIRTGSLAPSARNCRFIVVHPGSG